MGSGGSPGSICTSVRKAVFTSNLDEFFTLRVGSLSDLSIEDDENVNNKSGMTPIQQLDEIYK